MGAEKAFRGYRLTGSDAAAPASPSRRQLSGPRRLAYRLLSIPIDWAVRLLWASCRVEVVGEEKALAAMASGPVVPCLWHRDLCFGLLLLRRLGRAGLKPGVLISPSADGELSAMVARRLGFHIVRGSGTRTALRALRGMQRALLEEGVSPLVAGDGPRGPARQLKTGALALARQTGRPLLPMACAVAGAWRLGTWDRLVVPRPFARAWIVVGEARRVPHALDEDALERERLAVQGLLDALTRSARDLLPT